MNMIFTASQQWSSRPSDERFISLTELQAHTHRQRDRSTADVLSSRRIRAEAVGPKDDPRLQIETENGIVEPTHWSFGQLSQLAKAPAGYLRTLHPALTADLINYGLRFHRDPENVGWLSMDEPDGPDALRAATGPNYGRIWNSDIIDNLVNRFGDGISGDFRVPGEFGEAVSVNRSNTTIYGSDRDIFVFLADEQNRVEMPNRRGGQPGSLARGFFVWNSEVGSQSIGAAFFLFDYVCANRIVWGAENFTEMRLRHTKTAPDRWLEEITPVLNEYVHASAEPIEAQIKAAQAKKVEDDMDDFLKNRGFGRGEVASIVSAHEREEQRPMETIWDAVTGATAYAKTIEHQDARVDVERRAGKLLDLVDA